MQEPAGSVHEWGLSHSEKVNTLQSFPGHSAHEENPTKLTFTSGLEAGPDLTHKDLHVLVRASPLAPETLLPIWHPVTRTKGKVRPARSPESRQHSQPLSPFRAHPLPEARGAASRASLKCGAPQPWDPNESSGRLPRAKLWLPIPWTAATGETFATPACGWEMGKKQLRPEHSRPFPGYAAGRRLCLQLLGAGKPWLPAPAGSSPE